MKRNPFKSKEFEAYYRGYYIGREDSEKAYAERMAPVWPAVERALDLAKNMEPGDGEGNYFAWKYLMEELEMIVAQKPAENTHKKKKDPYLEYYLTHHHEQT